MDDVHLVRALEGIADLRTDAHEALRRQRALGLEDLVERAADDELHDEIEQTVVGLAEVEDRDRVRMREPARELRLAEEPLDHDSLGDEARGHDLDRDLAADRVLGAAVDRAHPALPELLDDRVATIELAADQLIGGLRDPDETRVVLRAALAGRKRRLARRAIELTRCTVEIHATHPKPRTDRPRPRRHRRASPSR